MTFAMDASIFEHSEETVLSELDLFSSRPTQATIKRGQVEANLPLTTTGEGTGDLLFSLRADGQHYLDTSQCYLGITVKVVKSDGTALDDDTDNVNVWPGDNFAHSLIKRVRVELGHKQIEDSGDYDLLAAAENALNFSKREKETVLYGTSGWIEDSSVGKEPSEMKDTDIKARKKLIAGSKLLSFHMKLRASVFNFNKLVYPGTEIKVAMERNLPAYSLCAASANPAGGAKVLITDAKMYVRKVEIASEVFNAHAEGLLKNGKFIYDHTRMRSSKYTIASGSSEANIKLDQSTRLPKTVVVGLTKASSVAGVYNENPTRFHHYDLSSVEIMQESLGEHVKYDVNHTTGEGLSHPYTSLASLCDANETGKTFGLTFASWRDGYNLYAADFSARKAGRDDTHGLVRRGSLTLSLRFRTATPAALVVWVLEEHDERVTLNGNREVNIVGSSL